MCQYLYMAGYIKKQNIICLTQEELRFMFERFKKNQMLERLAKEGMTLYDLQHNRAEMEKLALKMGKEGAKDRDEHEVFAALYVFSKYFDQDCQICFELSNFNPEKDAIDSFEELLRFRKVDSDSDFLIMQNDGLRKFQLKRYRDEMTAEKIFQFIKEKIEHYGGSLGNTNLWILLQPEAWSQQKIEFHEIHESIWTLHLKQDGHILVAYNEGDKENVTVEVYPKIQKTVRPTGRHTSSTL